MAGAGLPQLLLLATLTGLALWWPQRHRPQQAAWALATAAMLLGCLGLWLLPAVATAARPLGQLWNWAGGLLTLAGALLMMWALVRRTDMQRAEFGLRLRQRRGSLGPALMVSALVLGLHAAWLPWDRPQSGGVALETWLYQASLPGLMEEMLFRGLLLALAQRACPPRLRPRGWGGQPVGWAAAVVTLAFLALHGPSAASLLGVLPAALLFLWLRVFTGSLLLPVLVHNGWNLVLVAARA